MALPGDNKVTGNTGHVTDHNNLVDYTKTLVVKGTQQLNVLDYGATGNGRRLRNIVSTNTSPIITCAGASFAATDVGKLAVVYQDFGAGTVTTIASVQSATQITLAANSGLTASGTGAYLMYGTDDSAAINAALTAAAALAPSDITIGVNSPQGGGQCRVILPATTGSTYYCIASQLVVPAGVNLDCDGFIANMQADRYNPGMIFQPYSSYLRLYYEGLQGCGIQLGTSITGQADIHGGTAVLWHIGRSTEVGGLGRSTDGMVLLGYGFLLDIFWIKGGERGLFGNQGSDLSLNRGFIIGPHTGARFLNANQVRANFFLDSCGATGGGYSGVVLDQGCSDVNVNIQAFEVTGVTSSLDAVLDIGPTSTTLNIDIMVTVQAQRTGGYGVRIANAQDVQINGMFSNTTGGATGGSNMTTGVVYGTNIAGFCRISAIMNGSFTVTSGTLYGDLDVTQSGAGNNYRRFYAPVSFQNGTYIYAPAAAPTDANIGTSQLYFYLDEAGGNLKVRVRQSNGTTLKTATIAIA